MRNRVVVIFAAAFSAAVVYFGKTYEWPYLIGFAMGVFCGFGASDLMRADQKEPQEMRQSD